MFSPTLQKDWKCGACNYGTAYTFKEYFHLLSEPEEILRKITELSCGHFIHDSCISWLDAISFNPSLPDPHNTMKCATCKEPFSVKNSFTVPKPASLLTTNFCCLTMTVCAVAFAVAAYWMNT